MNLSKYLSLIYDILPTSRRNHNLSGYNIHKMDLTKLDSVKNTINSFKPNIIINCAAYTHVDNAETNREDCRNSNVLGLNNLLKSVDKNIYIIHISTDYVFNGEKGDYIESDTTYPVNYYGKTKLEAENLLIGSGYDYLILRPNVLYTNNLNESSFFTFIYNSLKLKKNISIVSDQLSNPVYVPEFIKVIKDCILLRYLGLLHYGSEDSISRYNFATMIAQVFKLDKELINPISSSDYLLENKGALRPLNSFLNINKIKKELNIETFNTRYFLTNFNYS